MNNNQKTFVGKVWFTLSKIDQFNFEEQQQIAHALVEKLKLHIEAPIRLKEFNAAVTKEIHAIDVETKTREARVAKEKAAAEKAAKIKAEQLAAEELAKIKEAEAQKTTEENTPIVDSVNPE